MVNKNNASERKARQMPLLSPIRTLTVGPGITPDLLTPRREIDNKQRKHHVSARGLPIRRTLFIHTFTGLPPVGNHTPP